MKSELTLEIKDIIKLIKDTYDLTDRENVKVIYHTRRESQGYYMNESDIEVPYFVVTLDES